AKSSAASAVMPPDNLQSDIIAFRGTHSEEQKMPSVTKNNTQFYGIESAFSSTQSDYGTKHPMDNTLTFVPVEVLNKPDMVNASCQFDPELERPVIVTVAPVALKSSSDDRSVEHLD